MKVLVTGGAGFIGSHVVDAYIDAGHDVVVIDDLSSGSKENLHKKAVFYKADITNAEELRKVFKKEDIEVVNHHAAQISVSASVKNPICDAEINILGGINLLELAVELDVKKFIFASTGGAIYGDTNNVPTPETHNPAPVSAYGTSKLSFEFYLKYYRTVKGLEYSTLRYSNVYGERQNPHGEAGVVAIFCEKMQADEQPVIYGDGKQTRDFVYVKDVASANLAALEKDPLNSYVNVATAVESSVNELFDLVVQASGKEIEKVYAAGREGEQLRSALDIEKAEKLLGWKPSFDLTSKKALPVFKDIYSSFK